MQFITLLAVWIMILAQCAMGIPKWHTDCDGRQYYIEEEQKYNWFEAQHLCAREGLQLVIIDTEAKNNALVELLKTVFDGEFRDLWLGANDEFSEEESAKRTFYWTPIGQPLNFTNWASNNPSNFLKQEHCVHIWDASKNYKWNDLVCTAKTGFICEPSRWCEKSKDISYSKIHQIQKALRISMQQLRNETNDKLNKVHQNNTEYILEMIREKNKSILTLTEKYYSPNIDADCSQYLKVNDENANLLFICNFIYRTMSDVNTKIALIQQEILESIQNIDIASKVEVNRLIAEEEADNEKLQNIMQFVLDNRNDDDIIKAFNRLSMNNFNKSLFAKPVIALFNEIIANKIGKPNLNADYNFIIPHIMQGSIQQVEDCESSGDHEDDTVIIESIFL